MIQFKCDICGRVIEPSKFESVNVLHITKCSGQNLDNEEVTDHRDVCNKCIWLLEKFMNNGLSMEKLLQTEFPQPPGTPSSFFDVEKFLNGDDEED